MLGLLGVGAEMRPRGRKVLRLGWQQQDVLRHTNVCGRLLVLDLLLAHSYVLAAATASTPRRRYDEEDEQLLLQADADVLQERQKQQEEWDAAAASREEYIAQARSFYEATYGERAKEKPCHMTSVAVEQILDVREEPYNVSN